MTAPAGLRLCAESHEPIAFASPSCPACELVREVRRLGEVANNKIAVADRLHDRIAELSGGRDA